MPSITRLVIACKQKTRCILGRNQLDHRAGQPRRLTLASWLVLALLGPQMAAASTFTNSIYGYADPFAVFSHDRYYLLGTGTGFIKVVSASSLHGLNSGTVAEVYNAHGFFESPELYWFGPPYNYWYIYYTQ